MTEAQVETIRRTFRTGRSKPLEWREAQLQALKNCLLENEESFRQALHDDLGKSPFECVMTELSMIYEELDHALKHLKGWMKPRSVSRPHPKYIWALDSLELFAEPYGLVLIISPWNYPIQLSLMPLVGAIAAGNCAVLKPADMAPACEKILSTLIPKYLDSDAIKVITGGKKVNQELLDMEWDYIFFTGSPGLGKIVMKAAAEHLTPVTLELGGKSPCVIDNAVDLKMASQRVVWGKFTNTGQTCIAPDYCLILPSLKEEFCQCLKETIIEMFGEDPQKSNDLGRIITDDHWKRLVKYFEQGTVYFGGQSDASSRYISPTILLDVDPKADVMQDEIFGPIFPILEVENMEAAVEFINKRPKPLALYLFSESKATQRLFRDHTSSGALMTNDTLIHITANTLPFGGVGNSGMGQYHGEYSFETFSHMKPIVHKSTSMEKANDHFRYPPYDDTKLSHLQTALRYPAK